MQIEAPREEAARSLVGWLDGRWVKLCGTLRASRVEPIGATRADASLSVGTICAATDGEAVNILPSFLVGRGELFAASTQLNGIALVLR